MKTIAMFILAAAACSAPLAAYAGPEKDFPGVRPGVSFGPRGSYFIPNESDADDGDIYGGAQLRFHLGKPLAIEGSAEYRRETFLGGTTRAHIWPVQASLLAFLLPDYRFTPYVLGGVGWYFRTIDGPGGFEETDNQFGPHLGAGLQFFIHRSWSLNADWRYVWLDDFRSRNRALQDVEFDGAGHQISAGLNYHF